MLSPFGLITLQCRLYPFERSSRDGGDLIFPVEGLVTRCLEGPEAAGNSEAPGFESNPFELKYVNRAFSGGVSLLATAYFLPTLRG